MKSFFSPLRTERTARKVHRTRHAARADVFDDASGSPIRGGGMRSGSISAPWRSRTELCKPNPVSTKLAAAHPVAAQVAETQDLSQQLTEKSASDEEEAAR